MHADAAEACLLQLTRKLRRTGVTVSGSRNEDPAHAEACHQLHSSSLLCKRFVGQASLLGEISLGLTICIERSGRGGVNAHDLTQPVQHRMEDWSGAIFEVPVAHRLQQHGRIDWWIELEQTESDDLQGLVFEMERAFFGNLCHFSLLLPGRNRPLGATG